LRDSTRPNCGRLEILSPIDSSASSDTESNCAQEDLDQEVQLSQKNNDGILSPKTDVATINGNKALIQLRKYVNVCLIPVSNSSERTSIKDLYIPYMAWCKNQSYDFIRTSKLFKDALKTIGISIHEESGESWYNYKLKPLNN